MLSARARFHAASDLTEEAVRILLEPVAQHVRFRTEPEIGVPTWLHSSGLSQPLERNVCFRHHGASAAAQASRLFGVACGTRKDPPSHHIYKSLKEASAHAEPEIERLFSKNYVHKWPPWDAIRQRWPPVVATNTGVHR